MDEGKYEGRWRAVRAEVENRIGWAILNRPEKRNAMSPALNDEMQKLLDAFEVDDSVGVVVLTGAGEAWSAGMDLKEYFREVDNAPEIVPGQNSEERLCLAVADVAHVCQADHRDGERLVLWWSVYSADSL